MLLFLHISIGYPSDSYKIHNGALQQNLHLSSEQDKEYSKTVDPHGYIIFEMYYHLKCTGSCTYILI